MVPALQWWLLKPMSRWLATYSTVEKCSICKHCLALTSLAWGLIVAGMHGKMEIIPQWWQKHSKDMTFLSWSLLPLILCLSPLFHLLSCWCHILPSITIHVPLFIGWGWCTKRGIDLPCISITNILAIGHWISHFCLLIFYFLH